MSDLDKIELDIAIVGGGFGGVYCAKSLEKRYAKTPGMRIGLISEENYMVFQPMLPEVVGGGLSPKHVINPIRQICKGIDVFKAKLEAIDLESRMLTVNIGLHSKRINIQFNHLVLSLGAEINLSRVPGMPEHAYLMQNVGDAMKLHSTVLSRCEEANLESRRQIKQRILSFVIVGGGFSGVETAGQIVDLLEEAHRYYKNIQSSECQVHLIHSGETILPSLSKSLGKYAESKLRKAGLKIHLNVRVKAVTSNQVYLNNGVIIDSNTVVCTIGNAPHSLVSQLCQTHNIGHDNGRIVTDMNMSVPGQKNLWALGDCARTPMKNGTFCPATAQFAMRQGTTCGQNIVASLEDRPLTPFTFGGLGELAAIGKRKAVANIIGLHLSGILAWWLWRTIYLMKLPGIERKVRVALDWTLDMFFSRDVNLLNPDSTKVINNIHLEPGDHLYNAGDNSYSLYIVIKGKIQLMSQGKVVKEILPGEFFGERELTKNVPFIHDAVAAESSELTSLDGQVFLSLVIHSSILKRTFRRTSTQYKTDEELKRIQAKMSKDSIGKTASDIMNDQLICLPEDMPLQEVASFIKAHRHTNYPVLDESGSCVGMISREDIFYILKSSTTDYSTPVGQLDMRQLPFCDTSCTTYHLMETMLTNNCSKVLVRDEEHRLKGIVTLLDLICEIPKEVLEEVPAMVD